jgi:hypothetical protein
MKAVLHHVNLGACALWYEGVASSDGTSGSGPVYSCTWAARHTRIRPPPVPIGSMELISLHSYWRPGGIFWWEPEGCLIQTWRFVSVFIQCFPPLLRVNSGLFTFPAARPSPVPANYQPEVPVITVHIQWPCSKDPRPAAPSAYRHWRHPYLGWPQLTALQGRITITPLPSK